MKFSTLNECTPTITNVDIVVAMRQVPGYLDITLSDFLTVYRLRHAVTDVVKYLADNDISDLPMIRKDRTVGSPWPMTTTV